MTLLEEKPRRPNRVPDCSGLYGKLLHHLSSTKCHGPRAAGVRW